MYISLYKLRSKYNYESLLDIKYLGHIVDNPFDRYIYLPQRIESTPVELGNIYFINYGDSNSCTRIDNQSLMNKLLISLYKPISFNTINLYAIKEFINRYAFHINYSSFDYFDYVFGRLFTKCSQ